MWFYHISFDHNFDGMQQAACTNKGLSFLIVCVFVGEQF